MRWRHGTCLPVSRAIWNIYQTQPGTSNVRPVIWEISHLARFNILNCPAGASGSWQFCKPLEPTPGPFPFHRPDKGSTPS